MICAGIDYGVRKVAVVILDGDTADVFEQVLGKPFENHTDVQLRALLHESTLAYMKGRKVRLTVVEAAWAKPTKGIRVGMRLAMMSSVLALAAGRAGSSVLEVPPGSWKKELIGNGSASKEVITAWLEAEHGALLPGATSQDVRDAACLALYAQRTLG